MNDSINVNYNFNKDDFFGFLIFYFWASPENKRKRINEMVKVTIITLGIVSLLIYIINPITTLEPPYLLNLVFSAFFLLIYFVGLNLRKRNLLKEYGIKILNNPMNRNMNLSVQFEFTDSFIFVKNRICESKLDWECITKAIEIKDFFYLFINESNVYIIPKKEFLSVEDLDRFQRILINKSGLLNFTFYE